MFEPCSCVSSEEHQLHHPPLPPIFYFHCLPFTLGLQVTANIVFLVIIVLYNCILILILGRVGVADFDFTHAACFPSFF